MLFADFFSRGAWMWGAIAFALAFVLASLVEYWLHRSMHKPEDTKLRLRHRDHHKRNEGQGVLWEFRDYVKGSLIAMVIPFAIAVPVGVGWFLGALTFAAFSAYAHQLQHENPRKCFWMKMPVHYVHHKYGMWHHNFGLAVDWWDRVFGTYKKVEWIEEEEIALNQQSVLQLRWW